MKRQDNFLTPSDVALGPPAHANQNYKTKNSPKSKRKDRDDKENGSVCWEIFMANFG